MELVRLNQVEHRLAKAWYIQYPLDAHALGPLRFDEFVSAEVAAAQAEEQFGERPKELWPEGEEQEVAEYAYTVDVPGVDRDMFELDPTDIPNDDAHCHVWGPVEHARFTDNPHRKCQICDAVSLDLDEDDDGTS